MTSGNAGRGVRPVHSGNALKEEDRQGGQTEKKKEDADVNEAAMNDSHDDVEASGEDLEKNEADITAEPPIRVARDPGNPTTEERNRHNVTHMPYKPWCPVCVEAKGRDDPHRRHKAGNEGEVPTIGVDYKSFGQSATEEDKCTLLIIRRPNVKNYVCPRG